MLLSHFFLSIFFYWKSFFFSLSKTIYSEISHTFYVVHIVWFLFYIWRGKAIKWKKKYND